jgi:L-iditol 2-dehydrogenase
MRALRLVRPGVLRLSEEAPPVPGDGEVMLRVTAVGLCGSDAHWYSEGAIGDAALGHPLVLGHEFAARIESGPRSGERVAVDPAVPCRRCEMCLSGSPHLCGALVFAGHGVTDGALRTFMAWPERCLVSLPDNLSDAEGALLEPLGVALHAASLASVRPGGTAGVFGCGPIGLLLIGALRWLGITSIVATDVLPHRLAAAGAAGATRVVQASATGSERAEVAEASGKRGLDVVFETAGTDAAVETAVTAARPGGQVVLIGIPSTERTSFPAATARRKELTLSLCRRMLFRDLVLAAGLAGRGAIRLDTLISHRFGLEQGDAAFATLVRRTGLKVIVEP